MTDQPNAPEPDDDATPGAHAATADHGEALERAARSIEEAEEAEGQVAANDDITVLDDQRAGAYSEDPDGTGGS